MRAGRLAIASAWLCLAVVRGRGLADPSLILSERGWWRQRACCLSRGRG